MSMTYNVFSGTLNPTHSLLIRVYPDVSGLLASVVIKLSN